MNGLVETSRAVLRRNSKSFALAARLLPRQVADDAAVVYAFCRRADDRIDLSPPHQREEALRELRAEVEALYSGAPHLLSDVVRRRQIPRAYLDELLEGLAMDVRGQRYPSLSGLLLYCHRVAGTVGLMMCHVMGVRDTRALRHAAHLGLAMQLTNICRDVVEDARNGRVYLPQGLLVRDLLSEANRYYRSADEGLRFLDLRCGIAVRTARLVYSEIGRVIEARGFDVSRRAIVPGWKKLWLAARAALCALPARRVRSAGRPLSLVRFPDDVLPL